MVSNPDDEAQIDIVVQSLIENSPMANHLIKDNYNLMVISQEQLEDKVKDSHEYFRVHPAEDINMFILFVKAEQNIAIMNRILQREMIDSNRLVAILNEYVGLFQVMAEEDPGYRQI